MLLTDTITATLTALSTTFISDKISLTVSEPSLVPDPGWVSL